LRNCKTIDSINIVKIKIKPTIIASGKDISILKFLGEFKFNSGNCFRIFYYERIIIHIILNKFYYQSKLEWTTKSIFYKNRILIRKGQEVVDIREFNRIAVSDVYFILLQFDVIRVMFGCKYISVIDRIDFFY
jgi:hypothetical protein